MTVIRYITQPESAHFPVFTSQQAIIYTSTEYGKGSDKFTVVFGWMRMANDG